MSYDALVNKEDDGGRGARAVDAEGDELDLNQLDLGSDIDLSKIESTGEEALLGNSTDDDSTLVRTHNDLVDWVVI